MRGVSSHTPEEEEEEEDCGEEAAESPQHSQPSPLSPSALH